MPPVLVHGWPGSIVEFHYLIGPLTDPASDGGDPSEAFDVVIPALPGFGFSGKPTEPGWGPARTAQGLPHPHDRRARLPPLRHPRAATGAPPSPPWMATYNPYAVDWRPPQHGLGLPDARTGASSPAPSPNPEHAAMIQRDEMGYFQTQSTKPMSLGIAQNDSPAGIAAWITEKFRTWSRLQRRHRERLHERPAAHEHHVLLGAQQRRFRREACTSSRAARSAGYNLNLWSPSASPMFPKELAAALANGSRAASNITQWTDMPQGGHFAALWSSPSFSWRTSASSPALSAHGPAR